MIPVILPPNWNPDPDKAWKLSKRFGIFFLISSGFTVVGFFLLSMTHSHSFLSAIFGLLTFIGVSVALTCLIPIAVSLPFVSLKLFKRYRSKK